MITADKRFQFYGRRKGKSLRRHHSELMEQLLPHLRVALDDPLSGMGERRWLEIGFGAGEHLEGGGERRPTVVGLVDAIEDVRRDPLMTAGDPRDLAGLAAASALPQRLEHLLDDDRGVAGVERIAVALEDEVERAVEIAEGQVELILAAEVPGAEDRERQRVVGVAAPRLVERRDRLVVAGEAEEGDRLVVEGAGVLGADREGEVEALDRLLVALEVGEADAVLDQDLDVERVLGQVGVVDLLRLVEPPLPAEERAEGGGRLDHRPLVAVDRVGAAVGVLGRVLVAEALVDGAEVVALERTEGVGEDRRVEGGLRPHVVTAHVEDVAEGDEDVGVAGKFRGCPLGQGRGGLEIAGLGEAADPQAVHPRQL